jgi:hypothetical protein
VFEGVRATICAWRPESLAKDRFSAGFDVKGCKPAEAIRPAGEASDPWFRGTNRNEYGSPGRPAGPEVLQDTETEAACIRGNYRTSVLTCQGGHRGAPPFRCVEGYSTRRQTVSAM